MTEPQPGADGGTRRRHRFRGAGVARARDQFHPPRAAAAGRPSAGLKDACWVERKTAASQQPQRRCSLPAINWRALGVSCGSAAARRAAALAALAWALDQPIETVAVDGRFQRVAPVDVERVVKAQLHGAGLLSVDLAAVRAAIHTLPWVDAVQRAARLAARADGAGGRAERRGALGRARAAQHARRAVRQPTSATSRRSSRSCRGRTARNRWWRSAISPPQGRLMQAGCASRRCALDARGAWEFDLANGVTVRLGRRQIDERFENSWTRR